MKTCKDCIFSCTAGDNETCERFKDASLFREEDMKKEENGED
jgi:hypothetical protein